MDPLNPAAITARPLAESLASSNALDAVTSLRQVLGGGASTCFVIRIASHDQTALERSIQSVLRQTEPNWEILLAPTNGVAINLDEWLDIDWRVRRLPEPPDSRPDLVRAALYATSQFVGVITQGDLIDDELVALIALRVRDHPNTDIIYTDEARICENFRLGDYFYKPDWSPEHLLSLNYVGRFVAFRKSRLLEVKVAPSASLEALDYDLLMESSRRAAQVVHIDEPLYFHADQTGRPIGGFFSDKALPEVRGILQAQVQRDDPLATVTLGRAKGALQVNWPVRNTPVTLVILTGMRRREIPGRGEVTLATHFVRSIIERSTLAEYRILLVDDGEIADDLRGLLALHGHQHRSYRPQRVFSFAKKANFAVRLVGEGLVVLLNDDMEVIDPDWIQALAGLALRPEIGAVGARLLYPDGTIQHAGIVMGYHGAAGHILHRVPGDGCEYGGFTSVMRNFSAVTGAAMAFRKSIFDEFDGFDEQFSVDYNDIDFCLRLRSAGYRIAVTPGATLYHFHNSSLKRSHDDEDERRAFKRRWAAVIARDPYYSKYFQRRHHELPLILSDIEPDK